MICWINSGERVPCCATTTAFTRWSPSPSPCLWTFSKGALVFVAAAAAIDHSNDIEDGFYVLNGYVEHNDESSKPQRPQLAACPGLAGPVGADSP